MKPACLEQIISGGQTGADQAGLYAAEAVGIKTGGMMPARFRTQAGSNYALAARFGLLEHSSWKYPPRTEVNVAGSDGTIIFGNPFSPGCALTINLCKQYHRPYEVNLTASQLRAWVEEKGIKVLNVAGNREETNPGIFERTKAVIVEAFQ